MEDHYSDTKLLDISRPGGERDYYIIGVRKYYTEWFRKKFVDLTYRGTFGKWYCEDGYPVYPDELMRYYLDSIVRCNVWALIEELDNE